MLREMFASLIIYGEKFFNAKEIWEKFKKDLYDDFTHKGLNETRAEKKAIHDIEMQLNKVGMTLVQYGIDVPDDEQEEENEKWDKNEELLLGNLMQESMNNRQKKIVKRVFDLLEKKEKAELEKGCIFIDGPGGSGKTYTYRTLCHLFRANNVKYKTCSWTGIASVLLPDGKTMHRTFALPFDTDKDVYSNSRKRNKSGRELIESDVIIIDEVSMVSRYVLEAIDKKLRELMDEPEKPFGGKIVIIGGDFRQVLPVKKRGKKSEVISLCVKYSKLWQHFETFRLKENKRAAKEAEKTNVSEQENFAEFLLKMGNGEIVTDENEYIETPKHCIVKEDLVEEIFGKLVDEKNYDEMSKRVILTTTNDRALKTNVEVINRIESTGENIRTYLSNDKVDEDEPKGYIEYPDEFLHSLNESGLPPHELKLFKKCPVILLRNLNPARGLCNGTRLTVKAMHKHHLECQFVTGERAGESVLIPRITLTSGKNKYPFTLYRRQFPVKICYAMTINKSQGQTIDYVGLDLEEPVFSHGQTYVGFSRARSWDCIKVAELLPNVTVGKYFFRNDLFNTRNNNGFVYISSKTSWCLLTFIVPIKSQTAVELCDKIHNFIEDGSIIMHDGLASYGKIDDMKKQFEHYEVIHKYNFVDPENPEVHTQTIESAWQKFKQANRKRYGTKRGDLFMLFLVEHMWRKKFAGRDSLFNFWTHVRETYKPVEGELEYRQTFDKEYDHDVFDDM